jgi:IS1 family transposase
VNVLKHEKKLAVLSALVEGNSVRAVSRMTGVHKTTILRLIIDTGEWCEKVMDERMRNLSCAEIEADEIWCFVGKKQKRLKPEEKKAGELGDAYTFVAFDPVSKLVPIVRVGKRDWTNTGSFIRELRARVKGRIQLSTDAFTPYADAVERAFGSDVDYAQIVKQYAEQDAGRGRYSPPEVIAVETTILQGNPRPERICTSYVERNNLTFRMQMRRFTRLTNGFSKKLANLRAMVWLWIAYYNFCRIHGSIRVTPAMAAGVTDHVWDLAELVA